MTSPATSNATDLHGTLLFAHGARDPAWARPFEAIAARMQAATPDQPLRLAYLELMLPDLPTAATALVEAGCRRITVVPLFLGAGGHVQRDLPALLTAVRQRHADIRITATPAIGEVPEIVQAIADTALQLMQRTP